LGSLQRSPNTADFFWRREEEWSREEEGERKREKV